MMRGHRFLFCSSKPSSGCFFSSKVSSLKTTKLTSLKRGKGGRGSFSGTVATVFGATGFLGRYVCNKLGKIGSQVIIPYRSNYFDDVRRLKLCGDLGQIVPVPFDLLDEESIKKSIKYSNVVINLIGREWETRNFTFECVHVEGARKIAKLTKCAEIENLIHISALNSNENPEKFLTSTGSKFLSSKAAGEEAVREEFPDAIIIKPADIWGSEDRFINYFCSRVRHKFYAKGGPLPLYKSGECSEKQPIYVGDVADGIIACINNKNAKGKCFQGVGPRRYLLSELVDWFHRLTNVNFRDNKYFRYDLRKDPFFKLDITLSTYIWNFLPREVLQHVHWDKIERECYSDKVDKDEATLSDLGVRLTPMEDLVPWMTRPRRAFAYFANIVPDKSSPPPPKYIPI